jgi:tetratricopeptide (TPR) repeat protein
MRILFHVEPLIEMQRPFFKMGWATVFARQIADSLLASGDPDLHFRIILNEPLSLRFYHDDIEKVVLTQREIFEAFGSSDYLEMSVAWQKNTYLEDQISRMSTLYLRKLGDFTPDIIICFSEVPYLARLFPKTLIFHQEYSIFSRNPYPETWFFDPCGMHDRTFLNTFSEEIKRSSFSEKEKLLLRNFKDRCRNLICNASPFRPLMEEWKRKHRALALLPLQFSGYAAFDSFVEHRSQYDYLVHVLESVPDGVGIVVTTHPDYNTMTAGIVEYLCYKYPNFIYHQDFEAYYSPSQYLLADIDSVITTSSSIGLQTLLWDIPLINPGGVWHFIASGSGLKDTPTGPCGCRTEERDAILFWILTRYAITKKRMSDSRWLLSFFKRSIDKKRTKGITPDFFDSFPDAELTFRELTDSLNTNIPEISTNYSYERAISIIHQKSTEARRLEGQIKLLKNELAHKNKLLDESGAATKKEERFRLLSAQDSNRATKPLAYMDLDTATDVFNRSPYQAKELALPQMSGRYLSQFTDDDLEAERRCLKAKDIPIAFRNMDQFLTGSHLTAEQAVKLGEGCYRIGYPAHAERFFMKAIAEDPGNSNTLNNLGAISFSLGNLREAERMFFLAFEKSLDKKIWHQEAKINLLNLYTAFPRVLYPAVDTYMFCPCCENTYPSFLPFAIPSTFNILCPRCNSLPRHRMLWMYMKESKNIQTHENMSLLHFAPEGVLSEYFASLPSVNYITADLYMENVTHKMDITDIKFEDNSFDAIICIHVLEHILDDHKAMRELHRVLKPGGWGLLQSPLNPSIEKTYEDPNIITPEERFKHFGQHDHVRIYGKDYGERLVNAGFKLTIEEYCRKLPDELIRRCGLNRDEDIYLCHKN